MNIHFIAIGGAVMHSLAIALSRKGYKVTGSDESINDPAARNLRREGIMPSEEGWFPGRIGDKTDMVIAGMHAREDNPELVKARKLGIEILSMPAFIARQTADKRRIVVAGSHGKTTITSMIMHVLRHNGFRFDYLTGSEVEGFDNQVHLDQSSTIAVIEGDEYPSSPIDVRPKFLHYRPHIAIINGIDWDHINAFPDEEEYCRQFSRFADSIEEGGTLLWFEGDRRVAGIIEKCRPDITNRSYRTHGYFSNRTGTYAANHNRMVQVSFFGGHNMQNLSAAYEACRAVGVDDDQFYEAIQSFRGASGRLERTDIDDNNIIYRDFAHSPSKVRATVEAVAEQHEGWNIIAVLELHTFSSLNSAFLPRYRDTLGGATTACILINKEIGGHKVLAPPSAEEIKGAFGGDNLMLFDSSRELFALMPELAKEKNIWLLMSSGNFGDESMEELGKKIKGAGDGS